MIITEINDKTGKALLNKGWIVKRFDGTWHDLCSENSYQRYIKPIEIIQTNDWVVRRVNEQEYPQTDRVALLQLCSR